MWIIKNEDFDSLVHCSSLDSAQHVYFFLKKNNVHCSLLHLTKKSFLKLYSQGKIISRYSIPQPTLFD